MELTILILYLLGGLIAARVANKVLGEDPSAEDIAFLFWPLVVIVFAIGLLMDLIEDNH